MPCESHPDGRGGGCPRPSFSSRWCSGACGRTPPWRRTPASAYGPCRGVPRWYGGGSRPPVRTGRATGGSTWPPPRAPRCWRPRRAGSRSRVRSPAAVCSRSSWPGRATRRCGSRTSRCARWSWRATRSRRARRWPCWRRGRPIARRAASTGGCAGPTRTWTRSRCWPRRCCATARRGCCRCTGCRCRSRRRRGGRKRGRRKRGRRRCVGMPRPPCWWCSACRGGGVSPGRRRPGRRRGSWRRRCRR